MARQRTSSTRKPTRKRNEETTDPIPAFYCVYLLQSTINPRSHYIGSTPDPARRIAQHNGRIIGGAKRTSKDTLRLWEMVLFVSGFMSRIAALQFEWAWQHTRKSHHVGPKEARAGLCRAGRSLGCLMFNLSVLLHSRCFSQWGLEVHFFNDGVWGEWKRQAVKAPKLVEEDWFGVVRHERSEELNGSMASFDTGENRNN
ncbi:Thymidylate kinase [Ascosphaera pollenicola]|nr:Thymidylate kinase [Ascosphaera pollenicola]